MKVGLVLEGGSMRGLYTAGVLDVMLDNNINIDGIIGTSAGALFGVNYFSKQKGRVIRYNKRFCNDKRNISLKSFITTGNIINKDFAFYKVPYELDIFDDEEYIKNNTGFLATVTNVETGKAEYLDVKSVFKDMEALRASSAIPLLSKIVEINGKKYLDGGIGDSIPVEKMLEQGYDKVIVVLTQPLGYKKEGLGSKKEKLVKLKYRRYPKFVKAMLDRHNRYNKCLETIERLEKENKIFVIRPGEKLNISVMERNQEELQKIYDLGVNMANEKIKSLKEYING